MCCLFYQMRLAYGLWNILKKQWLVLFFTSLFQLVVWAKRATAKVTLSEALPNCIENSKILLLYFHVAYRHTLNRSRNRLLFYCFCLLGNAVVISKKPIFAAVVLVPQNVSKFGMLAATEWLYSKMFEVTWRKVADLANTKTNLQQY